MKPDHSEVLRLFRAKHLFDKPIADALDAAIASLTHPQPVTPAGAGIDFPQVGFAGPFPIIDGRISIPEETMADLIHHARTGYVPVTPAGGEVVAYRYVADGGIYNPFIRDWLDGKPDQLDHDNIARHPGVRFDFAYSHPPVADAAPYAWAVTDDVACTLTLHKLKTEAEFVASALPAPKLIPLSVMRNYVEPADAALNQRGGGE